MGDWGWGEGADKGAKGSCGRLRYPLRSFPPGRSGITGNGKGSQRYIVSAERVTYKSKVSSIEATLRFQVPGPKSNPDLKYPYFSRWAPNLLKTKDIVAHRPSSLLVANQSCYGK